MQTPRPSFRKRSRQSGLALVVVLFAVALVSIVVLAYFNLALLNRNTSFSSAGEARANILALSALNFIKGDFVSEIQAGSTLEIDPNGSGVPIYLPTTNTTMLPFRMTTNVAYNASTPANLIKWSSGSVAFWTNTPSYGNNAGPKRGSSGISTANASVNGHYVGNSRWTKPDFSTSTTFPAAVVPEWVFMTRQGPLTNPATPISTLANPATANSSYVIGRYAYTVYDEGGLIDITAAGYSPSGFATYATDVGRKGSQAMADLTQIGLTTAQVETLGGWRNASSWSTASAYTNYLQTNAASSGFLQPAAGDQTFLSRQDLISYWTTQLGANAGFLTNLTTFSREKNAPSWGPEHDANDPNNLTYWNGSNTDVPYDSITLATNVPAGGVSYAYRTSQDVASSDNRFLPNVRVKTAFTRLSNEQAITGEPLVKNRFDLNKLSWITYNGVPPTGVSLQDIYNYFGLVANFSGGTFVSWVYDHSYLTVPSSATVVAPTTLVAIKTLDQVAAAGREPDFFELLQAGILRGSLGLCSGDPLQATSTLDGGPANENDAGGEFWRATILPPNGGTFPIDNASTSYRPISLDTSSIPHVVYGQAMFQVIQIGVNIIDQATTDNFPTDIMLDGENFYGDKNLPYLNAIGDAALRPANPPNLVQPTSGSSITSATTTDQAYVHRWLEFALWNPHQNAKTPPALSPTKFRICVAGGSEYPFIVGLGNSNPPTTPSPTPGTDYSGRIFEAPGTTISNATQGYVDGPAWIEVKLSDYANAFAEPTTITTAYTTDSDSPLDSATYNMNAVDGITQTTGGWSRSGIYLGWSKSPDNPYKVPACAAIWPNYATSSAKSLATVTFFPNELLPWIQERDASIFFNIPLKIYLQYEDTTTAGVWHTYEELHNFYSTRGASTSGDAYLEASDPAWTAWSTVPAYMPVPTTANGPPALNIWKGVWGSAATMTTGFPNTMDTYVQNLLDPRCIRQQLATQRGQIYTTGGTGITQMVNCNYASTSQASKGVPTGFHFVNPATPTGDAAWPGFAVTWVDNVSLAPTKNWDNLVASRTTYYRDRDYVPRVGDAAGWPTASPLLSGTIAQRPLQLNRPFRSVAELGYVFRDDPWKTLNFFSANSADAGLLDLFCIGPVSSATPTAPPPDIVAGKMNVNSAIANAISGGNTTTSPVLQALISQALRDYKSSASATGDATTINNSITTTADITGLAKSLMTFGKSNGPLISVGDVGGVFPQVPASSFPTPLYTGLKNPSEALVRALADSSGTRTWNLMIDVVAQAGKFNPTAASLNNFTVEGEKHYWLHVAIDRFTGEIIDQQLEPVWE